MNMFSLFCFVVFLLQLNVVNANFCARTDCRTCTGIKEISNIWVCAWCKNDNSCEGLGRNPCLGKEYFVNKTQCGYDQEVSLKMAILSATAYDLVHPQKCLATTLPSDKFQVQSVVTAECDIADPRYRHVFDNNCAGYVAVSNTTRVIAVAFRGSTIKDWAQIQTEVSSNVSHLPMEKFLGGEAITYWKKSFEGLWTCMVKEVRTAISKNPSYQIWVTGHSTGAAMASLASTWLAYYNITPRENIILYTFGSPRVGDYKYALQHDQLVNKTSWRIVNDVDLLPHFPAVYKPNVAYGPYHQGVEVFYTSKAYRVNEFFKQCYGTPQNEDAACSRSRIKASLQNLSRAIERHTNYFGITMNETYCEVSANGSVGSDKGSQFQKYHCSGHITESPTNATSFPTVNSSSSSRFLELLSIFFFTTVTCNACLGG